MSPNPPKEDGTIGPGGLVCSLGALRGKKEIRLGEKEVSTLGTQETGPGPVGSPLPGPPAKCPTGNLTSEMRQCHFGRGTHLPNSGLFANINV